MRAHLRIKYSLFSGDRHFGDRDHRALLAFVLLVALQIPKPSRKAEWMKGCATAKGWLYIFQLWPSFFLRSKNQRPAKITNSIAGITATAWNEVEAA